MKRITTLVSLIFIFSSCVSSQSLPTDSLNTAIRDLQKQMTDLAAQNAVYKNQISTLQKQIGDLSKTHTITFDPSAFTVQNSDSLNQKVSLKAIPNVDLTPLNTQITNLQNNSVLIGRLCAESKARIFCRTLKTCPKSL